MRASLVVVFRAGESRRRAMPDGAAARAEASDPVATVASERAGRVSATGTKFTANPETDSDVVLPSPTPTKTERRYVAPEAPEAEVAALAAAVRVPSLVARLLWNRGVRDPAAAAGFLAPKLAHLQA